METTTRSIKHGVGETVSCDYCGATLSLKVISWGNKHSCYTCYECKKFV